MTKLIMPPGVTADQLGVMDANRFAITADIAYKFHIINAPADPSEVVHERVSWLESLMW